MDDLTFSARRASAGAAVRTAEPADLDARFRTLVQSPLRAGILRYLNSRPDESFDVESLMQTFGRLKLDVENCVRELVDFGVARPAPDHPGQFGAERPSNPVLVDLLDHFLERRAAVSTEDQSPSVQRFREMIGRDEKMLIVFEWIRTAAKSDISVLILGPTGSGKEVVARMIHELSRRTDAKFQAVNCAALPDTLFESEIFGYEKGAFTGAHDRKPGRLELANEGTLFLDEIGDMSLIAQAKLLRVLEEREFMRVGGTETIRVDIRLVAASNQDLEQLVNQGRFRSDLYYRLKVVTLRIPPLRERREDIPLLANHFLRTFCKENGRETMRFSAEAARILEAAPWEGNVRELRNLIESLVILIPRQEITAADLPEEYGVAGPGAAVPPAPVVRPAPARAGSTEDVPRASVGEGLTMEEIERRAILSALDRTRGNRTQAAEMLGIGLRTLQRKLKEYRLASREEGDT
jgi:DNA-binding NtrC family response regulator